MSIPEAKLEALRTALNRDGEVRFKNGALVRTGIGLPIGVVHVVNGIRFKTLFGRDQLEAAYEYALEPGPSRPQPATAEELDAAYGKDPPW